MSANTDKDYLKQPEDDSIRLWRYMDFAKFVSLISSKQLFFCRSDLFDDPFEGSVPALVSMKRRGELNSPGNEFSKNLRQWVYISCWHANEHESAAMWDLYGQSDGAVAIETTYGRLKSLLPRNVDLGVVQYLDYSIEDLPVDQVGARFFCKRKSFEHEREVRGAIMLDLPQAKSKSWEDNEPGFIVPIELSDLITHIHVSPKAPNYLLELTNNVASTYGIKAEVKKSDLYSDPIF